MTSPAEHAADTTPALHGAVVRDRARLKGHTALLRFARHYIEMVVAMVIGMVVLDPLETLLTSALGQPHVLHGTMVMALVMAASMTVAVVGWMWLRRHRLRLIAEMAVAMNAAILALLVLVQVGLIGEHALLMSAHAVMFLAMFVAMLARRRQYMHPTR